MTKQNIFWLRKFILWISKTTTTDDPKEAAIDVKKSLKISDNFSLITDSDMIFVTVGTPQKMNGEINLSLFQTSH